MLGNTQNKDSVKEENEKLNFWFWFFSGLALTCAIIFVFAAISLLGMAFPGVFGGLWAGISKVPFLADMFGSVLFNLVDVVIMPIVFTFCVREAKKEIKSEEVKKVEEVKVINDEDKNKNEMKQNKEKNENHLENEIHENKINQDTNENNNKENKNNEVKERKPAEELKVNDDLRKKKQVSPQMENFNEDENQNIKK